MNKKNPVVIEFETQEEKQKFSEWALNPAKEKSEGVRRARNLINREREH